MFRSRRVTVAFLAGCLCVAAVLLIALNAFNLHFLKPSNSNGIFLFAALMAAISLGLTLALHRRPSAFACQAELAPASD